MSDDKVPTTSEFRGFFGWSGRFFIFILTGAALVLSIMSIFRCDFFSFDVSSEEGPLKGDYPIDISEGTETVFIGLFSYALDDNSQCNGYKHQFFKSDFGRAFIIAKGCSIAAPSFAALGWLLNSFFCLLKDFALGIHITFIFVSLACLAQVLTFLAFAQNDFCLSNGDFDCSLGSRGNYSVVAVFFLFLSSVVLCCMPKETGHGGSEDTGHYSEESSSSHQQITRASTDLEKGREEDDEFALNDDLWDATTIGKSVLGPRHVIVKDDGTQVSGISIPKEVDEEEEVVEEEDLA